MPAAGTGLAGELGFKRRDDSKAYQAAWRKKNRKSNNEYHNKYYHTKTKNNRATLDKHNEYSRWYRRKRKYGITKEQYSALLDKQDGKCYICEEVHGWDLRVDHDHETGQVRALLCNTCNAGLGQFKDNPFRLRAAAKYVEHHNEKRI